jgi:hypothetical protein
LQPAEETEGVASRRRSNKAARVDGKLSILIVVDPREDGEIKVVGSRA